MTFFSITLVVQSGLPGVRDNESLLAVIRAENHLEACMIADNLVVDPDYKGTAEARVIASGSGAILSWDEMFLVIRPVSNIAMRDLDHAERVALWPELAR